MHIESKNRFADGFRRVHRVYAYLPALAKIVAMMGSAVFNAIKWSGWVLRVKDGLGTPLGIILAVEQPFAAMVDTTVTRARGMVRLSHHEQDNPKPARSVSQLAIDENGLGPPLAPSPVDGMSAILNDRLAHLSQGLLAPPPATPIPRSPEAKFHMNGHHLHPNGHESFNEDSLSLTPYTNGIMSSSTNGMAIDTYGFIDEAEEKLPENLYKDATLCYPGVDGLGVMDSIAYRILQTLSILYMCNSATSGYLSTFSLVDLISRTPGLSFDGKCDSGQSEPWQLVMVNFVAMYLAYCSIISFSKYNLEKIQTYYGTLFVKSNEPNATRGEWHDISWRSYLMTFISVTTNTVGIAFTGKHTWDLLGDQALCHIGIPNIPESLKLFLVAQACVTNFSTNGIMTLCAVHNRNSGKFKRNISLLLEEAPSFKKWNTFITVNMFLYSLNIGLGTSVAVAQLPETLDPSLAGFSYNPSMILTGVTLGSIAFYSQFSLSVEGYHNELYKTGEDNRKKALLAKKSQSPSTALTLALLNVEHPLPRHENHAFEVSAEDSAPKSFLERAKESAYDALNIFSTHKPKRPHPNNLAEVNDPSTLPQLI